ncbi:hypothetical protein DPMN_057249 [Dreissena polymorpha]|uniref:Uncharacterized protein n=1 Tax=Dreissena polymorpha TaxID=45954 RepID=A0A9D4CVU9_DREPO|nr:hypothetical protein DPMN_057249 [Dreissena polymorpha]
MADAENIIGTNLLTKFHEDRKINVASRVLTRKNAPPGGHVFQQTSIIFKLVQDVIVMNLLTNFHEDQTINVASREKNTPPSGNHVFQANVSIFELIQDIIKTNLLTKFHEDWTINVASRELTRQMLNAHDGRRTTDKRRSQKLTMSTLCSDIIRTNLTKFHEDRKINVASSVKIAPPPGGHVFQPTGIIFFNMASRVLTRFYYSHIKNTSPLGSHVFQANGIMKCPATFQPCFSSKHWTINLASRVLTRKYEPPPWQPCFSTNRHHFRNHPKYYWDASLTKFHEDWTINVASREKAPPLGSHVFQAKVTIFELIQDIIGTNFPSKFYEDPKINVASRVLTRKNAPPPGGHVFQPTGIIFKLVQDIFGINLLTKFHEDRKINVACRVLTRFYYNHIKPYKENGPPLGSHGFQANVTIFKLIQDIIETNFLTKFHEDWK